MADHGYMYECHKRWQRMFGCGMDSVEWSARDILKDATEETVTVERTEDTLRVLCTGNGGRSPKWELLRAHFTGHICDQLWVENEPVQRISVRGGRWYRG